MLASCATVACTPSDAFAQNCTVANSISQCTAQGTVSTPVTLTTTDGIDLTSSATISVEGTEAVSGIKMISQGTAGNDSDLNGGAGLVVTVVNNGAISLTPTSTTTRIIGAQASSIGGDGSTPSDNDNGGNGGSAASASLTGNSSADITISASSSDTLNGGVIGMYASAQGGAGADANSGILDNYGGDGGVANAATVVSNGNVTLGSSGAALNGAGNAWGVAAASIGGAGGGFAKGPNSDNDPTGNGGSTGTNTSGSYAASATVTGNVAVYWNTAPGQQTQSVAGVVATSLGGAGGTVIWTDDHGGNGGIADVAQAIVGQSASTTRITVVANQAPTKDSAGVLVISEGGDGGDYGTDDATAGNGGSSAGASATLSNTAVTTGGDSVLGVLVRSRSGDGGGFGESGEEPPSDTIGGDGGQAGQASAALTNNSVITTSGTYAYGILSQSMGGLGGIGSKSGGAGANGGEAVATIDATSSVSTSGDYAAAIVTQSIAGGGGAGGYWSQWISDSSGNGGTGGTAGTSSVTTNGKLQTSGQYAYGVLVQSIGGSGGAGATGTGVIALGGNGGAGGAGGTADTTIGGTVATQGYGAIGALVQSIGGGGGTAGGASGVISVGGTAAGASDTSAGSVDASLSGTITTAGEAAIGLLAQSVGGGGGNGGSAEGVSAIGGSGGAGGNGGQVTVGLSDGATIITSGLYAHGAVAQSIGGGGGNGGSVFSLTAGTSVPALGGSGSGGGNGDSVTFTGDNFTATTTGDGAMGILLQSIGGGGGTGGSSSQTAVLSESSLAVGGAGGSAGNGGAISLTSSNAAVATQGQAAAAITAQSIGGGGGNGGAAHDAVAGVGFTSAMALGGNSGKAGDGGTVAVSLTDTTVSTASSTSNTALADSFGILAQSIGGGGGSGGSAQANSLTFAVPDPETPFAISTSLSIGGQGGAGGSGESVTIGLGDGANLTTGGIGSHGVLAQSIGGGGGTGGASHAMSTTVSTTAASLAVNVDVALGGAGGEGGSGGGINITQDAGSSVHTFNDFSNAMMGQSIGGGGGNAGIGSSNSGGKAAGQTITATIGVGGTGGSGGNGGTVNAQLNQGAVLQTQGSGSRGLLLQTIGGGGGASQGGTVSLSANISGGGDDDADDSFQAAVSVGVGGTGAAAGTGGTMTLSADGTITTAGGDADGILVQSIGGGGGLGGSAGADASGGPTSYSSDPDNADLQDDDSTGSYAMSLAVGGQGGGGGDGGTVNVNYAGTTATTGDHADGLVLQSIGGGGGVGGTSTASGVSGAAQVTMGVGGSGGSAGNGGAININTQGDGTWSKGAIVTKGDVAFGLLAQTIGGGGGQGTDGSAHTTHSNSEIPSVALGITGDTGNSGTGGDITSNGEILSALSVATGGFNSHGIVLQSIGGGGGTASVASGDISANGNYTGLDILLGGGGIHEENSAAPTNGGNIGIYSWLNVQTTGEHAFGLVAQTIGGGGGIVASGSADNVEAIILAQQPSSYFQTAISGDINITIGGNVGNVTPGGQSQILTTGTGSHGIVLQAIGGGGGIAGYTANGAISPGWNGISRVSAPVANASAGDIILEYTGILQTTGDGAYGIIAQSIADGGGLAGDSRGSYAGSAYDHTSSGYTGSYAGNVTILQSGSLTATGSNAYAIFAQSDGAVDNGKTVDVEIYGTVNAGSGGGVWIDGTAQTNKVTINSGGSLSSTGTTIKQTGTGSTIVTNYGNVAGSMSLSDQGVALGTIENFGTVLKAANINGHVINHGDYLVGLKQGTAASHISGDFTQDSGGVLHIGADFVSQKADLLQVDGTAQLDGMINVNSSRLMPGRPVVFLKANDIPTNTTLQGTSPLFDFDTQYAGGHGTVTAGEAHFDTLSQTYGAGRNLREIGSHLQDIWERGGTEDLASLYAKLDQTAAQGPASFNNALSSLSPGIAAAPAALKQADMARFASSLLSCPHYQNADRQLSESSCVWGQIAARKTSVDGSHGTSSFDASGVTYQVGMQHQIAPQWYAGLSAAYENGHITADDHRQRMSGDTGFLGASLKYESGPWTVAGTLSGSYGSYDSSRRIQLPGTNTTAKSSPEVFALGQRLRVAYTHKLDNAYIRPMVDLDVIYTSMPSYSENGAGALNLDYKHSDDWAVVLTPGIEVGGRVALGDGYVARPYLGMGLSLSSTDHWNSHAKLAAAPSGSRLATATLDTGSTFGRLTAGVQLFGGDKLDVRLQYDGLFSGQVHSHGGTLKASWRY
ncbi:hypothetical protein [Bordetella muralis]|uniref:hypothetical protein n=1 Tax=Bordetella muralis TaxID=1649130 RepID=UPI0039F0B6C7